MEPTEKYNTDNQKFSDPQSQVPIKANIYKPLFFTFFIFFLITASSLVTLSISKNKKSAPTQVSPQITVISPTSIPIVTDETQNWKTYTDSTYKYSIKYPSDLLQINKISDEMISIRDIKKSNNTNPMSTTPGFTITAYKNVSLLPNNDKNLSLINWIKQEQSTNIFSKEKSITVASLPAYQVTSGGESETEVVYIQKDNFILEISSSSSNISEIEQQIINSLKFN